MDQPVFLYEYYPFCSSSFRWSAIHSVAIIPVGEEGKVRVSIVGPGGISCRAICDNPLKNMSTGGVPGAVEDCGNGTFNLLGGYAEGKTVSTPISTKADRLIQLKVKTERKK